MSSTLLTRICSSWLQVALKTAALWAAIHVPIPDYTMYRRDATYAGRPEEGIEASYIAKVRRRARGMVEWLSRSGNCALNISVRDENSVSSPTKIYGIISDALIPFASRLGVLKFNVSKEIMGAISSLSSNAVPRLHTLTIHGYAAKSSKDPGRWSLCRIMRMPNLCNISYTSTREDFTNFPIRWGQFTSITIRKIADINQLSLNKLILIFSACPLLRYCHLEPDFRHGVDSTQMIPGPAQSSIPLLHLTELILYCIIPDMGTILYALHTPLLTKLVFSSEFAPYQPLLNLLKCTPLNLRSFELSPYQFSFAKLLECLSQTINLIDLNLFDTVRRNISSRDNFIDYSFFRLIDINLAHEYGAPDLLPQLQSFTCYAPSRLSEACVLEVVKRRQGHVAMHGSQKVAQLRRVQAACIGCDIDLQMSIEGVVKNLRLSRESFR